MSSSCYFEGPGCCFEGVFRVVLKVRDHSGQCPVQYLENIGPAIEHFDWLILVIGPLST